MSAELRLASGALEEHHHVARHDECEFAPEVLLHQRQREGSMPAVTPAGRAERAVANENLVVVHDQIGEVVPQFIRAFPVRRDAAAVEQPGRCEEEDPGAYRSRSGARWGNAGQ